MPKRAMIGSALTVAALALLLSFKTPQVASYGSTGNADVQGGNTVIQGGTTSQGGTTTGSGTYSGTVTGQAVQMPFGTVQVQVTLQNGKITDIVPVQMPSDQRRSAEIAAYAAPQLRSEVLAAQSTQVDTISGATYTSQAYLQSVQSALDQAHA